MPPGIRSFDVRHCLGRGGFGEVYRATMCTQGGLESDVALKVLRRDLNPSGQAVQRLRDEGKLLAKLDHPVILRVHDLAVLEGRVALITEYIAGEDLETLSGRRGPGRRGLLEIVAKLAQALDAAWNAPLRDGTPLRLVHRDIKPSNIRIGKHGEVKLLDFGIARTDAVSREARTQTDMMVGSPSYMAPERFRGEAVEPASDVFALGATLLEGLTGRRFFGRMELPRIAALALDRESYEEHVAKQLAALPDDIPDGLQQLVVDCLLYEHGERISAAELADRADRLAEQVGGDSLQRWSRTHRWRPEREELAEMSGRTLTESNEPTLAPRSGQPNAAAGGLRVVPLGETAPVGASNAPSVAPSAVPTVERGSGPRPWLIAVGLVFVVGSGAAGLLTAGAGGLAFQWWRAGEPSEVSVAEPLAPAGEEEDGVAEAPGDDPAAEPVAAPEAAPQPAPAPRPAPERPREEPAPSPVVVAPSTPDPEPVDEGASAPAEGAADETSVPERLPGAHLDVRGGIPVAAVGPGGRKELPSVLEPGHWRIEATFAGGRVVTVKELDIVSGDAFLVTCGARMQNCSVVRP